MVIFSTSHLSVNWAFAQFKQRISRLLAGDLPSCWLTQPLKHLLRCSKICLGICQSDTFWQQFHFTKSYGVNALPTFPSSLPFLPTILLTLSKWGGFLGLPLVENNLQVETYT